jgi:hypothetical protein
MTRTGTTLLVGCLSLALFASCVQPASRTEQDIAAAVIDFLKEERGIDDSLARASALPSEVRGEIAEDPASLSGCFRQLSRPPEDLVLGLLKFNTHEILWSHSGMVERVNYLIEGEETARSIIRLSRPAITTDGNSSLIYVERECPLCGLAALIYLKREGAAWTVSDQCLLLIS